MRAKILLVLIIMGVGGWYGNTQLGSYPLYHYALNRASQAVQEQLGSEKRDVFRASLEGTMNQQETTKVQFADALQELRANYGDSSSNLATTYDRLAGDLTRTTQSVSALKGRIDALDFIANRWFAEWEKEGQSFTDTNFKNTSLTELSQARSKYAALKASLDSSYNRTNTVLAQYREYTLVVKHALNASAVDSLASESKSITSELENLIAGMESSIAETQRFIESPEFRKQNAK